MRHLHLSAHFEYVAIAQLLKKVKAEEDGYCSQISAL